ncbi:helix-turn-helix domain-containing protein [Roseomonas sp. PWR1]|uniref:Helix-turn-helix domain-containing protein n=1 Tax=Roseomonas nitratireducens TaxID=2820810 RepID=A0ABS4ARB6_9PROT|nr:helix-turn-helix domain-containing protein [Neoroseomonas nitratireducens]MBP0463915.1 helix-turn-helix domain-containing protein [Neoroseomonas nitratireducens]
MSTLNHPAPAAGLMHSFAEPDRFSAALLGGEFEITPLHDEPFSATLRVLRVGDLVVQHADTSAHVTRGGIASGIAVLMLNMQITDRPARVNGVEVGRTDAVLATGGAEIAGHTPRRLRWAALALPLSLLEELAEIAAPDVHVPGAVSGVALPPDRAARLVSALSAAGEFAERLPERLHKPDCAAGLAMALRDEIAGALTAEAAFRPRPRAVGQALRLVREAETFMEARVARPVYTEELCAALGVSARRLHDAFRAALGTSPHAHLKSRRLTLARRALQRQANGPELVKSVALGHGFWHLGHFARDYRALFGELPSETLATAGTRAGPGCEGA